MPAQKRRKNQMANQPATQDTHSVEAKIDASQPQIRTDIGGSEDGRFAFQLSYEGVQALVSVMFRLFGVLMIFMAPMVWFLPLSAGDSATIAAQFGLTLFLFFCGLALFMRHHEDAQPEVDFDTNCNEMRVRQRDTKARWEIRATYGFDQIGSLRMTGRVLSVLDINGDLLVRMRLRDQASKDVMQSLLGDRFPEILTPSPQ
jgi:hypothetical protein